MKSTEEINKKIAENVNAIEKIEKEILMQRLSGYESNEGTIPFFTEEKARLKGQNDILKWVLTK